MKQYVVENIDCKTKKQVNSLLNKGRSYGEIIFKSCKFTTCSLHLKDIQRVRFSNCLFRKTIIDAAEECGLSFWKSQLYQSIVRNCVTRLAFIDCVNQEITFEYCPTVVLLRFAKSSFYQCNFSGIDGNQLRTDEHSIFIGCNPPVPSLDT